MPHFHDAVPHFHDAEPHFHDAVAYFYNAEHLKDDSDNDNDSDSDIKGWNRGFIFGVGGICLKSSVSWLVP